MALHIIKNNIDPHNIRDKLQWTTELESALDDSKTGLIAFHTRYQGKKIKTINALLSEQSKYKRYLGNTLYLPNIGPEVGANQIESASSIIHSTLDSALHEAKLMLDIHRTISDALGLVLSPHEIPTNESMTLPFVRSLDENRKYADPKTQDKADYYHYHIDELHKTDPSLPFKATSCAIQWHVSHPDPSINLRLYAILNHHAYETYKKNNQGHLNFPMGEIRGPAWLDVIRVRNTFTPPQKHRKIVGGTDPINLSDNYLTNIDKLYFSGKGIMGTPAICHNIVALKKPSAYTSEIRPHIAPTTISGIQDSFEWLENFVSEALYSDYARALSLQSYEEYHNKNIAHGL